MRALHLSGVVLFAWMCSGAVAKANDKPLLLQPSGAWSIDYGADGCTLSRTFEAPGKTARLNILQQAPGAYFRVSIDSEDFAVTSFATKVAFLPDSLPQTPAYLNVGSLGSTGSVNFTDSVQVNVPDQPQAYIAWTDEERDTRERSVFALSVSGGFSQDIELATGSMHEPMKALRSCVQDLYGSWGVDLKGQETLSRALRMTNDAAINRRLFRIFTDEMFRERSPLPPVFRVVVDEAGKPLSCRVSFLARHEDVADRACQVIMEQAKYSPALDAEGEPIVSYDTRVYSLFEAN